MSRVRNVACRVADPECAAVVLADDGLLLLKTAEVKRCGRNMTGVRTTLPGARATSPVGCTGSKEVVAYATRRQISLRVSLKYDCDH